MLLYIKGNLGALVGHLLHTKEGPHSSPDSPPNLSISRMSLAIDSWNSNRTRHIIIHDRPTTIHRSIDPLTIQPGAMDPV